jgi:hypothetical protein
MASLNAVPGRDQEFEEWYTQVHLRDVMRMPGARAAQRFRRTARQPLSAAASPYTYLTVYDVDDPSAVTAAHTAAAGTDRLVMSSAADLRNVSVHYFFPTSTRSSGRHREAADAALQLEFAGPVGDAAPIDELMTVLWETLDTAGTRAVVAEYRAIDQMFRRPPHATIVALVESRCPTSRLAEVAGPLLDDAAARPATATLFRAASPLVTSAAVLEDEPGMRELRARARAKSSPATPWGRGPDAER